jgi:2-polyprenyl-3-methyl-5-hydroxy-6-metoxy-1,4-benzoquinol methylase
VETLDVCPVCETAERSFVCEYNGLIALDSMRDTELARYDYALCHGCGLVYASRRPDRETYLELMVDFDENLGRATPWFESPASLQAWLERQDLDDLRSRAATGWLQSEQDEPADFVKHHWLDRNQQAAHLDVLSSLPLNGARILEIRTQTGWLLGRLRSLFQAEVHAIPAFEQHQLLLREVYEIPADTLLDFVDFTVPYDGAFDLIIARHMVTHALDPAAFLDECRKHLKPGGWIYFCVENDDTYMFQKRLNLFGEMRVFHLQNFDLPAYRRVVEARGFRTLFAQHLSKSSALMLLSQVSDDTRLETPIGSAELDDRRALYGHWRDLSVLALPEEPKQLFAAEVAEIEARLSDRDLALLRKKPLRFPHIEGYERMNRERSSAA